MATISGLNILGVLPKVISSLGGAGETTQLSSLLNMLNTLSLSQMKAAIATSGLNDELVLSIIFQNELDDKIKESVVGLYTEARAKTVNKGATDKGTASNQKYALSFNNVAKGALASAKAFAVAHPVITALMAAMAVIFAVSKIHDALTVTLEEHMEKLSAAKDKYSEITNELSSYQSELETTQARIKELQALQLEGKISAAEEKELDDLKRVNAELERKIALKKLEQEAAKEETAREFTDTMKSYWDEPGNTNRGPGGRRTAPKQTITWDADTYIKQYEEAQSKILAAEEAFLQKEITLAQKDAQVNHWQKKKDDAKAYLDEQIGTLNANLEGLEYFTAKEGETLQAWQEEANRQYELATEARHRYMLTVGGSEMQGVVFKDLLNSTRFDEAQDKFEGLADKGKLTAESIEDLYEESDNVKDFIDLLDELGVIDFDNLDDLAGLFDDVADSADNAEDSVSALSAAFEELDKGKSAIEAAANAFRDFAKDGKLSYSSIKDLAEAFGDVEGVDIESYIDTLSDAGLSASELNEALQSLVGSLLMAKVESGELTGLYKVRQ